MTEASIYYIWYFGWHFDKHNKKKILYLSDLILSLIIIIIPLLAITLNLII